MREGLLLELAGVDESGGTVAARRRSVEALARRFNGANDHGKQVARLALALFDGTAEMLGFTAERARTAWNMRRCCTTSGIRSIMIAITAIRTT